MIETVSNPSAVSMLHAILWMGVLTLVMFLWMYATRLPALRGVDPQEAARDPEFASKLPMRVRWVADNYNHLFEAPTIFYAVVLAVVLLGQADGLHATCAWAFVGLRAAHSLVQATVNRVVVRFALFCLSWVALAIIIIRAVLATL